MMNPNPIYQRTQKTDLLWSVGSPWKDSGEGPRGVKVKSLDCKNVVSEFELQSRYYVHFRTNTLGGGMTPLILPAMS